MRGIRFWTFLSVKNRDKSLEKRRKIKFSPRWCPWVSVTAEKRVLWPQSSKVLECFPTFFEKSGYHRQQAASPPPPPVHVQYERSVWAYHNAMCSWMTTSTCCWSTQIVLTSVSEYVQQIGRSIFSLYARRCRGRIEPRFLHFLLSSISLLSTSTFFLCTWNYFSLGAFQLPLYLSLL